MDRQLIERITMEEKTKLCMLGMDKVCVDLVINCLARIDAERGKEAKAFLITGTQLGMPYTDVTQRK